MGDLVAVLDELGLNTAYLMGRSWGGHLALHAATAIPDRLSGVLAIDPPGAVVTAMDLLTDRSAAL